MIELTPSAILKIREIMEKTDPVPQAIRIGVIGGGCSGFSYSLAFESGVAGQLDKVYKFEGTAPDGSKQELKVFIDQASMLYLDGVRVDYAETLEGAGFKFENPNVKSTCGCGSSFQA